jgi:CubicO group peptidase (beta-lactamase class C family)
MVLGVTLLWVAISSRAQASDGPPTDLTAQVDKIFEKWNRTDSSGCALSVMKGGRIVYQHGYGMADLDHNVTITTATVFHVASMSKQFTAASILLLAQQGKLSLDDDVRKYIPELLDFGSVITIRHLIYHISGLRDQWSLLQLAEKHVYCNTGYTLLAIIVKRVSGMSFRDDHGEIVKNNVMDTSQPRVKLSASASPTLTLRVRRVCTRQLEVSLCGMKTSITRALAGRRFVNKCCSEEN